jgi:N-acetylmuramoyl-L-alanine amidase
MSQPAHLKRRLLREAVAENLSTIEGRPPAHRRRPPTRAGRRLSAARIALVAAIPLILLGALYLARRGPATHAGAAPSPALDPSATAPAEDPASQLIFPAPRPMDVRAIPLEVRRITIDPGHGGVDQGTVGRGLTEKFLTLDIARRLRAQLERQSYSVHLTRDGDETLSLRQRAELANRIGSDLFLSIHINWLSTRQVRGIETYFLGPTEDPELTDLARRENRQSGYTLAEMRPLLEQIYTDFLQQESRRFASRVQRSLFASLRSVNPQLRNRGVKTAPFVVLVSTEMPAILAEVSCLSNREEEELLGRPLYREHIAEALSRGVQGYARDVNQTEEKGT